MKLLYKLNDLWKHGRLFLFKCPANWTFPGWMPARQMWVKVNGAWQRFFVRNAYALYSLGARQGQNPQNYVGLSMNGHRAIELLYPRSYILNLFNQNGDVTFQKVYDIYGESNGEVSGEIGKFVTDLNNLFKDQLFTISTFDEPAGGHLHPAILAAMYRIGATPAIFGQNMAYRGAYMLLGKVGFPAYYEGYRGEDYGNDSNTGGDPNAWISKRFTIYANSIILMPDNWTWGTSVRRDVFEIYSLGISQMQYDWGVAGMWVSDTFKSPVKVIQAGRSYNLSTFNANNAITNSWYYDVYYDAINGGLKNTNDFAKDLNALQVGQVFVISTFHEPSLGKDNVSLLEALERVGATSELINSQFEYGSAYMLIGKVGSPPYFEKYVGGPGDPVAGVGDPNASIKMSFFVENNEVHLVQ